MKESEDIVLQIIDIINPYLSDKGRLDPVEWFETLDDIQDLLEDWKDSWHYTI